MGAKPSAEAAPEDTFVDYYELLEVEQTDSTDAIRKAYRRLALRLHPDKNPGQEEEAKKRFVKLQEAYEVLSDDQERAWYDQNREHLIHGIEEEEDDDDVDAKFQFFRSGGAAPKAATMAAGIGVSHLLRFYAPSLAKDFSDSSTSFFGTYRRLFERLAEEDMVAGPYPGEAHTGDLAAAWRDDQRMYPSFGHPTTDYTSGSEPVRLFYQFWTQFSSRKSFAWKDQHDLRDAPDRRVRRLMEKDNKRARDIARKEYNDAIRGLASFIRRRDPRYKAFQAQQSAGNNAATQAEREEWRRAEAAKRQEEKRAQAASFHAQSWQVAEEPKNEWDDFSSGEELDALAQDHVGDSLSDDSFEEGEPLWDCVACNKRFQSEAAWSNHERSKKHKKEVQRLKREMLEDDLALDDVVQNTAALDVNDLGPVPAQMDTGETPQNEEENTRKKDKKRKKQAKKMQAAMEEDTLRSEAWTSSSSETFPHESRSQHEMRMQKIYEILPHLRDLPSYAERPRGSFDVFGYGSIIFKPPPHVISYTPGYIQGFVRRFAQHSEDHRGTPERPGRVVTLVSAEHWHSLPGADEAPEGDIVWGLSYTIDPAYADEVRAYLDDREKNGYTPMWAPILGYYGRSEEPQVLVPEALVYVGLPDNEAFVGPQPLDELAERIHTCHGPSGPNDEYLLRLAEAVRILTPESKDNHLFSLEEKVLALKAQSEHLASRKPRRKAKAKPPPGSEVCNECHASFPSRSKLFQHVNEKGHALASSHGKRGKK
ncbi:hypothetical protein MCAP1_000019 [Malassezia caprae]|uniref:Uncharacterized protein n=1 Tax=Malassezia caprae TaxID=1381934 RepID=A0AAF0E2N1_9BASI|nr:hypothetical protein MCAP1_000019 [Malassezia caprae]